ncbi:hypothetical protein FIBSPDRAFT_969553 [Athelia psychrophila]|uniref:Importin N-terminal domain-containing protein n=1 Tax=Athelia psychrophila TaxID=1759441 RepID=A0A167TEC6_9AGAM|nr:hypothetical protein FIBSPDRAFT_969553 [Fibularhizoctonia sp. CBS 109695]
MPRPQPQLGLATEAINLEELYAVISGAASQDVAQLQACTERLKMMMDMTGTFDGLSDIASQKTSVPLAVRQQSIIQFKNHALSHWRSRKLLTDEARARIRSRCLMMLDEEDDLIAQCNEEIISKIARSDFPGNWSNLVTDLMTTIETNLQIRYSSNAADPRTTLVLRRSIKALNGIVFEFTTIRMLTGVATLKNVSSSPHWLFPKLNDVGFKLFTYLHQPLWKYYETISSPFASTLNPDSIALPRTAEDLLLAHLIYEAVFHLTTWLWQRHGKDGKDEFEGLRPWVCGIA